MALTRYILSLAFWLTFVAETGISVGHDMKAPDPLPPYRLRVLSIEMQIVQAAMRHGISPRRALNRAWSESKYTDAVSACCFGPLQLHKRLFPSVSLSEGIDAGVGHLAELIRRYGMHAEAVYRKGHL